MTEPTELHIYTARFAQTVEVEVEGKKRAHSYAHVVCTSYERALQLLREKMPKASFISINQIDYNAGSFVFVDHGAPMIVDAPPKVERSAMYFLANVTEKTAKIKMGRDWCLLNKVRPFCVQGHYAVASPGSANVDSRIPGVLVATNPDVTKVSTDIDVIYEQVGESLSRLFAVAEIYAKQLSGDKT